MSTPWCHNDGMSRCDSVLSIKIRAKARPPPVLHPQYSTSLRLRCLLRLPSSRSQHAQHFFSGPLAGNHFFNQWLKPFSGSPPLAARPLSFCLIPCVRPGTAVHTASSSLYRGTKTAVAVSEISSAPVPRSASAIGNTHAFGGSSPVPRHAVP